jgi:hypothetical protein
MQTSMYSCCPGIHPGLCKHGFACAIRMARDHPMCKTRLAHRVGSSCSELIYDSGIAYSACAQESHYTTPYRAFVDWRGVSVIDEFWKPIGAGPACSFHSPRTLIVTLEFSVLRRGRSTYVVGAHLLLLAEKVQFPWPVSSSYAGPWFTRGLSWSERRWS